MKSWTLEEIIAERPCSRYLADDARLLRELLAYALRIIF